MTTAPPPGGTVPEGGDLGQQALSLAASVADVAQTAVRGVVDEQKTAVADQVAVVAQALDTVAERVERVLPQAAPLVREAVSTVHVASDALREKSLDDLLAMTADFGRRQPAAFLGLCTLGGFILARFLKSSADRQREERERRSARTREAAAPSPGVEPGA